MRSILLFCLGSSIASASVVDAIALVESSGNTRAVGDNGLAKGAWQMHRAAWNDSAKRLRVTWDFDIDSFNYDRARRIAAEHLRWLCEQFTRKTGRQPTPADQYALWNLGVAGYAKRDWDLSRCPTITQRAVQKLNTLVKN